MSFLDMNFEDVVEPRAVDPDKEYKLRIVDVREGIDKNGNAYLMPRLEILDEVGAKDFTYFMGLPNDGVDPKRLNAMKYKLKTFMDAFGISYNSDPANEWPGSEGWAILGLEESPEWGAQNYIKRLVKSS